MADSQSGVPILADTGGLSRLARDLRAAAPVAWKAYRVGVRAAAQPVMTDAQQRASFSKRIPGSMHIRVTGGGNVKIVAGGDAAPDAAPIENKGKGHVRHPVFGNRDAWTAKNSPPAFLTPALDAHRQEVALAIEHEVYTAVARVVEGR